ncbi:MAG: hypothetical protein JXR10_00375 [Cyclobacteriaceae bacterium]
MPKKVKLELTLSKGELWWTSDKGVNWAPVGPKSPTTMLGEKDELQWICNDGSIDELEIKIDSGIVIDPATGSKTDKTSKVNAKSKNGDRTKYTILINGGSISVDPDVVKCLNPPCPVGS